MSSNELTIYQKLTEPKMQSFSEGLEMLEEAGYDPEVGLSEYKRIFQLVNIMTVGEYDPRGFVAFMRKFLPEKVAEAESMYRHDFDLSDEEEQLEWRADWESHIWDTIHEEAFADIDSEEKLQPLIAKALIQQEFLYPPEMLSINLVWQCLPEFCKWINWFGKEKHASFVAANFESPKTDDLFETHLLSEAMESDDLWFATDALETIVVENSQANDLMHWLKEELTGYEDYEYVIGASGTHFEGSVVVLGKLL